MDEAINASATATIVIALTLSFLAILVANFQRASGKPLLAREPRQRVPWGAIAIVVPLYCVIAPFLQLFIADTTAEAEIDPAEFMFDGLVFSLVTVGFVALAMPWMAKVCGATKRDLGLPTSPRQFVQDIGLGAFACLVSLLPIYSVQFILTAILQPEQEHQLIEQIIQHRSPQILLAGAVMAVIAAPLFEEFTFRLLLQGWLERREDEIFGIQEATEQPILPVELQEGGLTQPAINHDAITEHRVGLLPHGWMPLFISSLAFGLAHVGHGVAPISLVLFGIVLGYLYQRTHRLVPCITAHALFNAYSMSLLWLQIR